MAFDQQAISTLFARVVSPCKQIGAFRSSVIQHEPKAAPTALPALALWWSGIGPARGFSGLDVTSARIEFKGRVYVNFKSRDEDDIDPSLMTLTSAVIGAFSSAFTLDGDVAFIDLLGGWGAPLSATPGYIQQDGQEFRVAELVLPVVVDDVWTQVP
ncbi:MAG: hypothetical protein ACRDVE_02515 [Actinocrinis sp.]